MKTIFNYFLIYCIINILATVFFIILFHIPCINVGVFFYRGIFFIAFATLFAMGCMVYCKKKFMHLIDFKDILMEGVCFFCLTLTYFTLLPVTVERSISVYMLSYMAKHENKSFTPQQFEEIFYDNYVKENHAMQKRFLEQEATGSIQKVQNGHRISHNGKRLVKLFQIISFLFHTDKQIINEF